MEITGEVLAAVPAGNVQVPLDEFRTAWQEAEDECVRLVLTAFGSRDAYYASGVMSAYRWLASCQVPMGAPSNPLWTPAPVPVPTGPQRFGEGAVTTANPQTVGYVCEHAYVLKLQFPQGWITQPGEPPQPGHLEGIYDALRWAHYGPYIAPRPSLASPGAQPA